MSQKTRDGLKLKTVLSALEKLTGVTIRFGNSHPYIAIRQGYAIPCPIAASTDARRMVVPWIKQVSSYKNSNQIYQALKNGGWN